MFRKKETKSGMLAMSVIGGMVGGIAAVYLRPQLEKQMGRINNQQKQSANVSIPNMMTEMGKEILPALNEGANVNNDTFQEMVDTFIEQEQ